MASYDLTRIPALRDLQELGRRAYLRWRPMLPPR